MPAGQPENRDSFVASHSHLAPENGRTVEVFRASCELDHEREKRRK